MQTFSQILFHSKSAGLWREAYFYHLVKTYIQDFCDCEYSQIQPNLRPVNFFINRNQTIITVKISSPNRNLLSDLTQKKQHLAYILHYYLVSKNIIQKHWQINLKIIN